MARPQGWAFTSMARFSPADAVKTLPYCGEAFVDQRLKLVVGEDVGPNRASGLRKRRGTHGRTSRSLDRRVVSSQPGADRRVAIIL